jgi:hypothetical protein
LANHQWDEPLNKIAQNNIFTGVALLIPQIGEPVFLKDPEKECIYKNLLSVIKRSLYLYIICFRLRASLILARNKKIK